MDAISCLPPATYNVSSSTGAAIAHFSASSSELLEPCSSSSPLFAAGCNWFASQSPMAEPVVVASTKRQPGPRGGGAGRKPPKRKRRPSKRAPTTYISTDPASFRSMVHHVTGAHARLSPSAMLPPYGDAVFSRDDALLLPADADADAAALRFRQQQQEQQQQEACFPTLDSWSVDDMYKYNNDQI